MKKYILMMLCVFAAMQCHAGSGDDRITIAAGFQFPSTLDAQIGFEHDLSYGNSIEAGRLPYATCSGKAITGTAG